MGAGPTYICRICSHRVKSEHQHHYDTCRCGAIAVDGGEYVRLIGNLKDFIPFDPEAFRDPVYIAFVQNNARHTRFLVAATAELLDQELRELTSDHGWEDMELRFVERSAGAVPVRQWSMLDESRVPYVQPE